MSQGLKYYIYIGESVEGPHDMEYIKSMNLNSATKICPEGSTEWTSLEDFQRIKTSSLPPVNEFLPLSSQEPIPTKIGKYNVVNEIGRGGMGSVYLAIDEVLNRKVAIKELKIDEHKRRDSEAYNTMMRRFKKEAQILAQLNHKNIVSVFDIVEQEQNQYIIMEYLDGSNLEEKLNEKGILPLLEAVSVIADVCLALDYIHKRSIVHRDIKPSNIVILSDGVVKLTDFGVTRDLNSMTMTMDGSLVGTIAYASPEQDSRDLDGRSDIFSLGVVLYEFVTGQKPFTGDTIASVLLKIATKEPVKPTQINPKIHKMLENIILKAMAKNLSQRYATAMDMYNDLMTYKQALEENDFNLLAGQKSNDTLFSPNNNKVDSIPPGKVQSKDIFKHSIPPGKLTMNDINQARVDLQPTQPPMVKPGLNTAVNMKNPFQKAGYTTLSGQKLPEETLKAIEEVSKTGNTGNLVQEKTKEINTTNIINKAPVTEELDKTSATDSLEKSTGSLENAKTEKKTKTNKVNKNNPNLKKFVFPTILSLVTLFLLYISVFNFFDILILNGIIWGGYYDYHKKKLIKPLSYILMFTSIFVIFLSAKMIFPSFENSKISSTVYYVLDISLFLISAIASYSLLNSLDKLSLDQDKKNRLISTALKTILASLSIILIFSSTSFIHNSSIKQQLEKSKLTDLFTSLYRDYKPGKKLNISIGKFGLTIK
ncbi:MAG: serine/threonine-protein kinase [Candidatus Sericytochromatia bacterium]